MSKTIGLLLNSYPWLEDKLNAYENVFTHDEALRSLETEEERTFLKLIWFFENPKENSFDINLLYQNLVGERLAFALDLIASYFRNDTYLLQGTGHNLILSSTEYVNQSEFARELINAGLDYTQAKVATYRKRGKFAEEDVVISGVPYWSRATVENYIEYLKLYRDSEYKPYADYTIEKTPVYKGEKEKSSIEYKGEKEKSSIEYKVNPSNSFTIDTPVEYEVDKKKKEQ
ncbi:hypothetical protein [Bacillus cereus group sp. BfR-BA-01026]|uniref:hypothetical protein n=1 Tax=Bacillus cereus group sp. BfR-BA-01026 TaxID=3094872 RepID=UPI0029C45FD4|nr:hypothetical protein [Bacillus cereus group sp. BfR-BA-01026]MDX5917502.1 hypothetical protein [Bacillus cereus group sp. BfR-BA-01026]